MDPVSGTRAEMGLCRAPARPRRLGPARAAARRCRVHRMPLPTRHPDRASVWSRVVCRWFARSTRPRPHHWRRAAPAVPEALGTTDSETATRPGAAHPAPSRLDAPIATSRASGRPRRRPPHRRCGSMTRAIVTRHPGAVTALQWRGSRPRCHLTGGTRIGVYEIESVIGEGGMGVVVPRARHESQACGRHQSPFRRAGPCRRAPPVPARGADRLFTQPSPHRRGA